MLAVHQCMGKMQNNTGNISFNIFEVKEVKAGIPLFRLG
jgi:hypothetical protein